MKTKIKQLTVIIALLLLCTIVLSFTYGCTKEDSNRFDTDLFCCMYNEDKTGVIILELTEKGQEQEILVIPEEINGLPVVKLGEVIGYPNHLHYLESEKAKKVYIYRMPKQISGKLQFPNATVVLFDIGGESKQGRASVLSSGYVFSQKVVYSFELIEDEWIYKEGYQNSCTANVFFFINGELRYIDYIEQNGVYLFPQDYDAKIKNIEWYVDLEYREKWDNQLTISSGDLKLYGKEKGGEKR